MKKSFFLILVFMPFFYGVPSDQMSYLPIFTIFWAFSGIGFLGLFLLLIFKNSEKFQTAKQNKTKEKVDKDARVVSDLPDLSAVQTNEMEMIADYLNQLPDQTEIKGYKVYFYFNGGFVLLMEKNGLLLIRSTGQEKYQATLEFLNQLKNKKYFQLGSGTNVIYPFLSKNQLFGFTEVSIQSENSRHKIDDILSATSMFTEKLSRWQKYREAVCEVETGFYNYTHFQNILNLKANANGNEALVLVSCDSENLQDFLVELSLKLNKALKALPGYFRISERSIAFFLPPVAILMLKQSLPTVYSEMKKQYPSAVMNIGVAEYDPKYRSSQKWWNRAVSALESSIEEGNNRLKSYTSL